MPVLTANGRRVLYIHVPKTGGTSVDELLGSYGGQLTGHAATRARGLPCTPQHFHGDLLRQVYGTGDDRHDFDFVFMTVRDPIDRLLSEFRHQRTRGRKRATRYAGGRARPPLAALAGFGLWVDYALGRTRRDRYFSDNHLRPQSEFRIWDPETFRLEDGLVEVKQRLDSVFGLEGTLPSQPRMTSTDRSGSRSDLRGSRLDRARDFYLEDFANFGY